MAQAPKKADAGRSRAASRSSQRPTSRPARTQTSTSGGDTAGLQQRLQSQFTEMQRQMPGPQGMQGSPQSYEQAQRARMDAMGKGQVNFQTGQQPQPWTPPQGMPMPQRPQTGGVGGQMTGGGGGGDEQMRAFAQDAGSRVGQYTQQAQDEIGRQKNMSASMGMSPSMGGGQDRRLPFEGGMSSPAPPFGGGTRVTGNPFAGGGLPSAPSAPAARPKPKPKATGAPSRSKMTTSAKKSAPPARKSAPVKAKAKKR